MLPIPIIAFTISAASLGFMRLRKKKLSADKFLLIQWCKKNGFNCSDDNTFDPNALAQNGEPLLIHAIAHGIHIGDFQYVNSLLELGANPNVHDKTGRSALSILISQNFDSSLIPEQTALLSSFINHGADVNILDSSGKSPLFYAKCYEIASKLLKAGAIPNAFATDGTPLLTWVLQNDALDVMLIRTLLQADVNPNIKDPLGNAPLFYAKSNQIIKELLQAGADPNSRSADGTPILIKLIRDKAPLECIKTLLQHKANPNITDADGKTPYDFSDDYSLKSALLIQLKIAGADILCDNSEENPYGYTMNDYEKNPLLAIKKAIRRDDIVQVQKLLLSGINANFLIEHNSRRFSLLQEAAYRHAPAVMRLLIMNGADVNYRGEYLEPLIITSTNNDLMCFKTLINTDAIKNAEFIMSENPDIIELYYQLTNINDMPHSTLELINRHHNHPNKTFTNLDFEFDRLYGRLSLDDALLKAVEMYDTLATKLLLQKGANPNAVYHDKYCNGWPLLKMAVQKNAPEIIALLAEAGADVNRGHNSISPMDSATIGNRTECVRTLLEHGAKLKDSLYYLDETNLELRRLLLDA